MLTGVINIFGGPGTGKSTVASGLFYLMKNSHVSVELIPEYAKALTWEERINILSGDQLYVFAKQHRQIFRLMSSNIEYAIADSPLLLSAIYFDSKSNIYERDLAIPLFMNTFDKYPNINVYLRRNDKFQYQETGRNQKEEEARDVDKRILDFLKFYDVKYIDMLSDNETIFKILKMIVDEDSYNSSVNNMYEQISKLKALIM